MNGETEKCELERGAGPLEGRMPSSDDLTLAFDVEGQEDRPTVFLMHGGGQTRHSWSGAARALVDRGYRVVNYDARGHGDSDWSSQGAYSLTDRVDDLRAMLSLSSPRFALVGASLGGATALLATAAGILPAGLVLVDIVPEPQPEGIERITRFMSAHPNGFGSLEEAVDAVAAYNPTRPRSGASAGLMRNLRRRSDGRLYWHWDPRIMELKPATHHAQVQEAAREVGRRAVVPIMLVRGLASDVVSDAGVLKFKALVPGLEVSDVSQAGHMVAGDNNDSFVSAIMNFLERCLPLESGS